MKPQDLRIGNLVILCVANVNHYGKIHSLTPSHLLIGDGIKCDYSDLEPIIITEEWLLKCGFTPCESLFKDKPNILSVQISNNETLDYEDGELFIANVGSHRVVTLWNNIIHLHQLQNLYYAITGEELEVKP